MKKILTLLLCTVLFCACSDDDDNNNPNSRLNGSWNLDSYTAFMETLPVLEDGDITWTISNNGTNITVVNTVESEYPYMMPSGTYNAIITDTVISITAEEQQKYDFSFIDGGLVLTDINETGDGPILKFSRN
jgi:hypothetical protein